MSATGPCQLEEVAVWCLRNTEFLQPNMWNRWNVQKPVHAKYTQKIMLTSTFKRNTLDNTWDTTSSLLKWGILFSVEIWNDCFTAIWCFYHECTACVKVNQLLFDVFACFCMASAWERRHAWHQNKLCDWRWKTFLFYAKRKNKWNCFEMDINVIFLIKNWFSVMLCNCGELHPTV